MRPPDESVRDRIRTDLSTSLFVSAGAGTGKTTAIVDRIVARVAAGADDGRPLRRIVAITFTEKAAGEMIQRLRRALDDRLRAAQGGSDERRWREALEDLETASIGTIHSFAASILREFPVEALVDPGFTVADDTERALLLEEAWEAWLFETLASAGEDHPILRAGLLGLGLGAVKALALDLLRRRATLRGLEVAPAGEAPAPEAVRDRLAALGKEIRGHAPRVGDANLTARLGRIADWAEAPARLEGLALERRLLDSDPEIQHISSKKGEPSARTEALRAVGEALVDLLTPFRARTAEALAAGVGRLLADPVRGIAATYEARKTARGLLDFDDLLERAAALLEDPSKGPRIAALLRARWDEVLVDEFQDTDPLQAAIVRAIGWRGDRPGDAPCVVLVGDPKQSIYRFRRAEIGVFRSMGRAYEAAGGNRRISLRTNFRAVGDLVRWTNHVFGEAFGRTAVSYEPIEAAPGAPDRAGPGPAVRALRCAPVPAGPSGRRRAADLRAAEADAIVRHIAHLRRTSEPVRPWGSEPKGPPRPFSFRDAALLFRSLTGIETYARALEEAGIPHRVIGGRGFFGAEEVSALVLVLRAVANPADSIGVAGALRSSAFGLSDSDLVRLAEAGVFRGRARPDLPDLPHAVAALRTLEDLRLLARRLPPAALAGAVLDRTGLRLAAAAAENPAQALANLDQAVEVLRAFEGAGRASLVEAAAFLADRADEETAEVEAAAADETDDVVRIVTVHRAKGLEFPVVYLAGISTREPARAPAALPLDGRLEVRLGSTKDPWTLYEPSERKPARKRIESVPDIDSGLPRERQAYVSTPGYHRALRGGGETTGEEREEAEEETRIAYVAATRARDLLVVPLPSPRPPSRRERAGDPDPPWWSCYAEKRFIGKIAGGLPSPEEGGAETEVGGVCVGIVEATALPPADPAEGPAVWTADAARRFVEEAAARLAAARARLGAATPAEEEDEEGAGPADDLSDHPAARRPRSRRARIGRAVHKALARADLWTFADVEAHARRAADEEGVVDSEGAAEVVRLAAAARAATPFLAGAAVLRREVPFVLGTREGAIDVVAETADGAIVLDWKTDDVTGAALDEWVARYRTQVDRYAAAAEAAYGRPPRRRLLVFLAAGAVVEV